MYEPNIKYVTMTFISWFNKFALYLQEHAMHEHYAFAYESADHVQLGGPINDNNLTVDNHLWRCHIGRITTVMNVYHIINVSISL